MAPHRRTVTFGKALRTWLLGESDVEPTGGMRYDQSIKEAIKEDLLRDPDLRAALMINDPAIRAQIVKRVAAEAAFDGTVESAVAQKMRFGLVAMLLSAIIATLVIFFPFKNFYDAKNEAVQAFNDAKTEAESARSAIQDAQSQTEAEANKAIAEAQRTTRAIDDLTKNRAEDIRKLHEAVEHWTPEQLQALNLASEVELLKLRGVRIQMGSASVGNGLHEDSPDGSRWYTSKERVAFGQPFERTPSVLVSVVAEQFKSQSAVPLSYWVKPDRVDASGFTILALVGSKNKNPPPAEFSSFRVQWIAIQLPEEATSPLSAQPSP